MADNTPQFGTAEYSNVPGTERCGLCQQLIGTSYYRVNDRMACARCAERIKSGMPVDSPSSYSKALLFGLGGAFVGFLLYSAIGMATGWVIGYMSLAVGWLVGTAMKKGANGAGGRKYQITAAVLTYAAVSISAIPIQVYLARGEQIDWANHIGTLIVAGLLSPFLDLANGIGGVIGLVILWVGIQYAWRATAARPLSVDGPYENAPPKFAGASGA